ncbi:competence/damage-inducible protein A [Labrys neptuniae]
MQTPVEAAPQSVTAAILVVGDEILSGRTKDKNIGYIAEFLTGAGVDVKEVRVVPDEEDRIIEAVNALRARYDYVLSTGGIGPTHDDITADSVAKAFGVGIEIDPRAVEAMTKHYGGAANLTPARLRMARIPDGAELVDNPVSAAPGFMLGNVVVMAGVPNIMQRMLDNAVLKMRTGAVTLSDNVSPGPGIGEGAVAAPLAAIAQAHGDVSIGSYPSFGPDGFQTQLVIRGKDAAKIAAAKADIEAMVAAIKR